MSQRSRVLFVLAFGILAASQSGNLVRLGGATHPVAIVAWRLLIASVLLSPVAGTRLASLGRLSLRQAGVLLVASLALAGHLVTWVAAVQHTTVANAAIFFAVNPVLTALGGTWLFGERLTPRFWLSAGLGLAGIAILGWGDLDAGPEALYGDGLALVCSVFFTLYFLAGKSLRSVLDNRVYVTALYGTASLASFVVLVALARPVASYSAQAWLCFGLMALVPTVLGHTGLNYALKYMDAGRVSLATLAEPALAGLVAWVAWGEPLTLQSLVGYAVICAAVALLVTERHAATPEPYTGEPA